jgi:serine/threonine-protein kinase HipA
MKEIKYCPGTLAEGFDKYSPLCLKRVFNGKSVNHILDFSYDAEENDIADYINQISVSGVQEKLSAIVDKGKIVLTPQGVQGTYIIKPAPNYKHLKFRNQIPANEHLTMQIASQIYKIKTAENALTFFSNGEIAYITKRFDIAADGTKINQEDFSSLASKTSVTHGKDFKYTGSYVDLALLIRNNVSAWQVEMSKFFTLVVFNYLFANGDAHQKNFSLQQSPNGDYLLAPAYDLMNTSLHVKDSDFALEGGLFPKEEYSEIYELTGHPCSDDFIHFGHRIGVPEKKIKKIIEMFTTSQPLVMELIGNSFLDDKLKRMYLRSYEERLSRLRRLDEFI